MSKRRAKTLAYTLVLFAAWIVHPDAHAQQPARRFAFALIGDLAYQPAQEPQLERVLADINRTPLAFVAHVGDLASAKRGCTDELLTYRQSQFRASAHPFIYTPGDNEWADC